MYDMETNKATKKIHIIADLITCSWYTQLYTCEQYNGQDVIAHVECKNIKINDY